MGEIRIVGPDNILIQCARKSIINAVSVKIYLHINTSMHIQ